MKPKGTDAPASTEDEQRPAHWFKPGQSGNPAGRPKGSKQRLSENFIAALCQDFETHGQTVINTVRAEKPADYLKIIASIVPKELTIKTETIEDMSDDELIERLDQVRSVAAALLGSEATSRAGSTRGKTKPRTAH